MIQVEGAMPDPEVTLFVETDGDCGGAAMYGKDGRWYWTHNGTKAREILHRVVEWTYMYPKRKENM